MISLRPFFLRTTVVAAAFLAACSDGPGDPLSKGLKPGSANLDGKVGDVGNAAKNGDIDVRVLLDKSGNALLFVRTGTFDPATGAAQPNGYFQSIQYKIYNASGKQVQVKNIKFDKTDDVQVFSSYIDLCSSSNDRYDDDADDDGIRSVPTCPTKFGAGSTVSVQANLKNVGGDPKKTDVVREDGVVGFLPDIDVSTQAITVFGTGTTSTVVPVGSPTVFSVNIPNNKPATPTGPGSAAVNVTCVVFVNGFPQLPVASPILNPNQFSYVSDPTLTIGANGTGQCRFSLTLKAGTYAIKVVASPVLPGDFDYSNNTTQSFTFSAIAEQPDVVAGALQINSQPVSSVTVVAGTPVELDQWVSLASGGAPGTVTCTTTITPVGGGTPATLISTASLPSTNSTAACKANYTFPGLGQYDVVTVVTLPPGFTDTNPANNTSATTRITINTGAPTSNVTLGPITYTDPQITTVINGVPTPISSVLGATSPAASEDSVHNKDVAKYSTPVSVALQFASTVDVTCSASVDGKALTTANFPGFAWTSGPVLTGLTAGSNASCAFTLPFNSTDFTARQGIQHTIVFSITTSIQNTAPPASRTVTGVVAEFVRADLSVSAFELKTGATTWVPLTGNKVNQATTDTIRSIVSNPSAFAVNVACGTLAKRVTTPTTFTMPPENIALPALLAPVTLTPTITVPANGSAACQYALSTPTAVGLISIDITAIELPVDVATNPQDPNPLNNPAVGNFSVKSNGQFSGLPPATATQLITAIQQWHNAPTTAGTTVDTLIKQQVTVKDLALLVVKTTATLGDFKLTTTVTSPGPSPITFGTSVIQGTLLAAGPLGENCDNVYADAGTPLAGTSPASPPTTNNTTPLIYSASVCARQSDTQAGFQEITVNYSQGIGGPILGSLNPLLITSSVVVRIVLDFTLTGAGLPADRVSATVTIPVQSFLSASGCQLDAVAGRFLNCATQFAPFTITTP